MKTSCGPAEKLDTGNLMSYTLISSTFSTHAGWSNNPFLAKTSWLKENVADHVGYDDWTTTIESGLNLSPFLWDEKCFIIAQTEGLFTHKDIDRPIEDQSPYEDPFSEKIVYRKRVYDNLWGEVYRDEQDKHYNIREVKQTSKG
eukprot:snap_masked-scaffold_3-processed-gene-14.23-mRNA-1 protein AED:1.00 eAED:1.00 QI:0/0/0/0/1/1/2/0/143